MVAAHLDLVEDSLPLVANPTVSSPARRGYRASGWETGRADVRGR